MTIKLLNPKETWDEMQGNGEAILVDVRSIEEFSGGHPQGAINIPIFLQDPRTGNRYPNPDFEKVVKHHLPKDKSIYLSCKTGQRSFMAAMKMQAMGYEMLINVQGGMDGNEKTQGWQELGLPVSQEKGPEIDYQPLLEKVID